MTSKLWYLTSVSLKRKIKTKWFVIANVLLALLLIGLFNIDTVIQLFGGDFNEKKPMYLVDETNGVSEFFIEALNQTEYNIRGTESSYEVTNYTKGLEEAKKEALENSKILVLHFTYDENHLLKTTILSKGTIDTLPYQILSSSIQTTKVNLALKESSIDIEELNRIESPATIERVILDDNTKGDEESAQMIMSTIFPFVIMPIFMLTMFLVQMIGAEVNDEKSTRGMEIIISNVSPKTHFFSKILSGNLFVFIQAGLLFLYTSIAYFTKTLIGGSKIVGGVEEAVGDMVHQILNSGVGEQLIILLPLIILLIILTFVGYSLLAGILASMTTNTEDFQQLQSPIMMISLLGYFLAMMAGMFQGSIFIKICSYLPFVSAILSPSLLVLGHIGILDICISIILMMLINGILIRYGLRIYKVGILNYSSKNLWKKMFQALKEKS